MHTRKRGNIVTISRPFLATLRNLYHAQREVLKSLVEMAGAAQDPRLQACFRVHAVETQEQISRLDYVFAGLGVRPTGRACRIAVWLTSECAQTAKAARMGGGTGDAALACRGQALGHYEIARYRALIAWADNDQRDDIVDLLDIAIDEERNAIRLLGSIVETAAGRQAMQAWSRSVATRSAAAPLLEEPF
jgi:ferritin-like metal-binding protein YciE